MWDDRYNRADYVYGEQPNDFLKAQAARIPTGRVLCLAEGEGRNAVYLASLGYDVTAVDQSAVGLEKAQKLANKHGVSIETHVADLADFNLGQEMWDGIVSIFCHLPPPLRQSLHQRLTPALKPNGVFLLESYTEKQLTFKTGGPPVAELMHSKSLLETELSALHFDVLHEIERDVYEGVGHHGHAAVVQAIATKR